MKILARDSSRLLVSVGAAITLHVGILVIAELAVPDRVIPDSSTIKVSLETRIVSPREAGEPDTTNPDVENHTLAKPVVPVSPPEETTAQEFGISKPDDTELVAVEPVDGEPVSGDVVDVESSIRDLPTIEPQVSKQDDATPARIEPIPTTQNFDEFRRRDPGYADPPQVNRIPSAYTQPPDTRATGDGGDPEPMPVIRPERYVEPRYPEAARRGSIEGTVVVHLQVDRRGRVADATLRQSSGSELLDREALRTVRLWRFSRDDAGRESVHRIVFRLE